MREKPYCSMALYILRDKAVLPTSALTPSRFTISIEPIQVFDYQDKLQFLAALKNAIEQGFPKVPDPPAEELVQHEDGIPGFKNPPVMKYVTADSWDDLERKSIFVSLECYPSQYLVESWGHSSDGKWSDDKLLELRLPSQVGLEVVIDAILDHLRTRNDLPGFSFGQSQQQTAKGA
ncbi:MAG: hypothetical protein K8F91_17310 [Candidatus Obscuribacterales bacterium]|nr:hypothetical protein [Candidatus Obscuribacterales bacterium]